jgi:hypothetical protein
MVFAHPGRSGLSSHALIWRMQDGDVAPLLRSRAPTASAISDDLLEPIRHDSENSSQKRCGAVLVEPADVYVVGLVYTPRASSTRRSARRCVRSTAVAERTIEARVGGLHHSARAKQ